MESELVELILPPDQMQLEQGLCWVVSRPPEAALGDDVDNPARCLPGGGIGRPYWEFRLHPHTFSTTLTGVTCPYDRPGSGLLRECRLRCGCIVQANRMAA